MTAGARSEIRIILAILVIFVASFLGSCSAIIYDACVWVDEKGSHEKANTYEVCRLLFWIKEPK